jgi:hypothetical protein
LALAVTQLVGLAAAQDEPLCGPPGEEVPATIVGAGTIVGTAGDDVIVGMRTTPSWALAATTSSAVRAATTGCWVATATTS